jgi:hypothetical protein
VLARLSPDHRVPRFQFSFSQLRRKKSDNLLLKQKIRTPKTFLTKTFKNGFFYTRNDYFIQAFHCSFTKVKTTAFATENR